jgi:hypothetical protein
VAVGSPVGRSGCRLVRLVDRLRVGGVSGWIWLAGVWCVCPVGGGRAALVPAGHGPGEQGDQASADQGVEQPADGEFDGGRALDA